jgi:hypothetical protein
MLTLLLFLAFFVLLGVVSALGLGADSRDTSYTLAGLRDTQRDATASRVLSGRRGPRSSADRAPAF